MSSTDDTTPPHSNRKRDTYIIIGVIFGVFGLIAAIALIVYLVHHHSQNRRDMSSELNYSSQRGSLPLPSVNNANSPYLYTQSLPNLTDSSPQYAEWTASSY